MKTSIPFVLGFATLALSALERPALANTSLTRDAEDSPLFATSMRNSFAEMLARDHTPSGQPVLPESAFGAGGIIAVEGTKWHLVLSPPPVSGPRPRDVTTDVTCVGPTCPSTSTCGPNITCQIFGKTCQGYPTCGGGVTCNGASTCYGVSTCYYSATCQGWNTCTTTCSGSYTCNGGPTCAGYPTCVGWPTCGGPATCGGATCWNTCVVSVCQRPNITGVNVPAPGQFQFSFSAQGQSVSYHVLYCTNLDLSQWTDVFSVPANNSTVTFTHTNNAPRAYYRLSIQSL